MPSKKKDNGTRFSNSRDLLRTGRPKSNQVPPVLPARTDLGPSNARCVNLRLSPMT